MASQALGLAEAMGFPYIEKRLEIRFPMGLFAAGLWLFPLAGGARDGQGD